MKNILIVVIVVAVLAVLVYLYYVRRYVVTVQRFDAVNKTVDLLNGGQVVTLKPNGVAAVLQDGRSYSVDGNKNALVIEKNGQVLRTISFSSMTTGKL